MDYYQTLTGTDKGNPKPSVEFSSVSSEILLEISLHSSYMSGVSKTYAKCYSQVKMTNVIFNMKSSSPTCAKLDAHAIAAIDGAHLLLIGPLNLWVGRTIYPKTQASVN